MDTERLQIIKDRIDTGLLPRPDAMELVTALEAAQAELAEAKHEWKVTEKMWKKTIAERDKLHDERIDLRVQLAEAAVEKIALENALAHIDSAQKQQLAEAQDTLALAKVDKSYIEMANKFIDLNNLTKLWWIYIDQRKEIDNE